MTDKPKQPPAEMTKRLSEHYRTPARKAETDREIAEKARRKPKAPKKR